MPVSRPPRFHSCVCVYYVRLRVQAGSKFVDLGSGAGKPCVAAALLFDFASCVGIEFLQGVHAISQVRCDVSRTTRA
jgi:cyclopropane fatty-acyl-phospholipid synthase-like methyltransferase